MCGWRSRMHRRHASRPNKAMDDRPMRCPEERSALCRLPHAQPHHAQEQAGEARTQGSRTGNAYDIIDGVSRAFPVSNADPAFMHGTSKGFSTGQNAHSGFAGGRICAAVPQ